MHNEPRKKCQCGNGRSYTYTIPEGQCRKRTVVHRAQVSDTNRVRIRVGHAGRLRARPMSGRLEVRYAGTGELWEDTTFQRFATDGASMHGMLMTTYRQRPGTSKGRAASRYGALDTFDSARSRIQQYT